MSIRARLLLSYILMSFLPLILLAITLYLILNAFVGDFIGRYHLDFSDNKNPFKVIMTEQKEVFTDMKLQASTDPDQLLNPSLLDSWESQLNPINMSIVLQKTINWYMHRLPWIKQRLQKHLIPLKCPVALLIIFISRITIHFNTKI